MIFQLNLYIFQVKVSLLNFIFFALLWPKLLLGILCRIHYDTKATDSILYD